MNAPRRLPLALALCLAAGKSSLTAQETAAEPPASPPSITVTWDKGVDIASVGRENVFQLGTLVQFDGRFNPDDPTSTVADTFLLRRLRPIIQGRVARYFEFRVMPDFGNDSSVVYDAYLDTRLSKSFRVRVGKDKPPIGLEQLYSDYSLLFPERSLATNLVPTRDIGVQAIGEAGAGALAYAGGVFNGARDGEVGGIDTNSAKDLVGRLTIRPFKATNVTPLDGLGLAIAGSHGDEAGTLPSFKSTAQQIFFTYASTATANGERSRVSPSAFYYYRSIGAFAEYVRSSQAVLSAVTSDTTKVENYAWEVTGSLVVTGEPATDKGVVPSRPFEPARHQWGALQLAARHSHLAVDPAASSEGLATPSSSRSVSATGVSAIWYLNGYIKYVLSFERTVFDGDPHGKRAAEHALIFRLQLNVQPSL